MNIVKELSTVMGNAPKEVTDNCFRDFFRADPVALQNQLFFLYYYLLQFEDHDELKQYLIEELQLVHPDFQLDLDKVPEKSFHLLKVLLS